MAGAVLEQQQQRADGVGVLMTTFWRWLTQQKDRDDPVGDFARDAIADRTFPRRVDTRHALECYLLAEHACDDAMRAFRRAHAAWKRTVA